MSVDYFRKKDIEADYRPNPRFDLKQRSIVDFIDYTAPKNYRLPSKKPKLLKSLKIVPYEEIRWIDYLNWISNPGEGRKFDSVQLEVQETTDGTVNAFYEQHRRNKEVTAKYNYAMRLYAKKEAENALKTAKEDGRVLNCLERLSLFLFFLNKTLKSPLSLFRES